MQQITGSGLDFESLGFDLVEEFLSAVVWWTVKKRKTPNGEIVFDLDVKPNAVFVIEKERFKPDDEFFIGVDAAIPKEPFPEGEKRINSYSFSCVCHLLGLRLNLGFGLQ